MQKNLHALTNPQKSIWQTEQFYKGTSIENISGTTTILEKVDFNKLEQAINIFVKKNDSFRLKFVIDNNDIKQYFENFNNFTLSKFKVNTESDLKKIEKELSLTPFELINSFLFKFVLFEFPDGHGGFIITLHHLIGDAWTSGLGISEIIDIYSALIKNETISEEIFPSYIDYINSETEYLSSEKYLKDKEFWNSLYNSIPENATIPNISNIQVNNLSSSAKRKQFILSKDYINLINNFCKTRQIFNIQFLYGSNFYLYWKTFFFTRFCNWNPNFK